MATHHIDMSHFFRVQHARLNNLSRQIAKDHERILQIVQEGNKKIDQAKKDKKS